jgi:hypothetical protein
MVKSSANLKNVGFVSGFIKNPKGIPVILSFSGISWNCFYIGKSHELSLWITAGIQSMVDSRPWGGTATRGLRRSS